MFVSPIKMIVPFLIMTHYEKRKCDFLFPMISIENKTNLWVFGIYK